MEPVQVDKTIPIYHQISEDTWTKGYSHDGRARNLANWIVARYSPVATHETTNETFWAIVNEIADAISVYFPSRYDPELGQISLIAAFGAHTNTTLDDVRLVLMRAGY